MDTQASYLQIIEKVKANRNGDVSLSMARMGIFYGVNYGVSVSVLKEIAQFYHGDHELALFLFDQDIRECKILASLIDDPHKVTGEQMDSWIQSFTNSEIVEQVCSNLFWKSEYALSRSIEWCLSNDELLQKAGMIIAARRATDNEVKDAVFDPYIDIVDNFDEGQMAQAKITVSFTLRQIALRNSDFRAKVFSLAKRMAESDDESRAWVGSQLLYELESVDE